MTKRSLIQWVLHFTEHAEQNRVSLRTALRKDIVGMRMYDAPLFGFAAADDPAFLQLQEENVVGSHLVLPKEWLQSANTVVSMFFPLTQRVLVSNAADMSWPSDEWLHARVDGQRFIELLCAELRDYLADLGYESIVPAQDARFWSNSSNRSAKPSFTSNWSERHAAYVCGLGTFGLSRGLITEKGTAGRLASVITALPLEPTLRPYTSFDAYCTMCGACVKNCPVGAISLVSGKNQELCGVFVDEKTKEKHPPYFGCGKCQIRVPCSTSNPLRTVEGWKHKNPGKKD